MEFRQGLCRHAETSQAERVDAGGRLGEPDPSLDTGERSRLEVSGGSSLDQLHGPAWLAGIARAKRRNGPLSRLCSAYEGRLLQAGDSTRVLSWSWRSLYATSRRLEQASRQRICSWLVSVDTNSSSDLHEQTRLNTEELQALFKPIEQSHLISIGPSAHGEDDLTASNAL
jgi:hypothetical protein